MKLYTSLEPDPREGKLPVWAQKALADLRRELERAIAHADETRLATKPDETDTVVYRYSDEPIGLDPGATVEFRLGGPTPTPDRFHDNYLHAHVVTDKWGTRLEISSGRMALQVSPKSGNSIVITTPER